MEYSARPPRTYGDRRHGRRARTDPGRPRGRRRSPQHDRPRRRHRSAREQGDLLGVAGQSDRRRPGAPSNGARARERPVDSGCAARPCRLQQWRVPRRGIDGEAVQPRSANCRSKFSSSWTGPRWLSAVRASSGISARSSPTTSVHRNSAAGGASSSALRRTAAGRTGTTRRTSRDAGAPWECAAAATRCAPYRRRTRDQASP